MASVLAVRGIEHTSDAFRRGVIEMSARIDANPDFILAVMSFETGGTFDPAIRNPLSGAVGLIQFTKGAAAMVGSSRDELGAMTAEEQLSYVERYLKFGKGRFHTLADHYLAVFAPAGMGKGPAHVLFRQGVDGKRYEQNKGFDVDKDGAITVAEATAPVQWIVQNATGRIEVSDTAGGGNDDVIEAASGIGAVLGMLGLILGIHTLKRLGRLRT